MADRMTVDKAGYPGLFHSYRYPVVDDVQKKANHRLACTSKSADRKTSAQFLALLRLHLEYHVPSEHLQCMKSIDILDQI